jgi:hypothetical protein
VEAEAAAADEADAAVEAFEAAAVQSEPDGGEDSVTVAADRARKQGPQSRSYAVGIAALNTRIFIRTLDYARTVAGSVVGLPRRAFNHPHTRAPQPAPAFTRPAPSSRRVARFADRARLGRKGFRSTGGRGVYPARARRPQR